VNLEYPNLSVILGSMWSCCRLDGVVNSNTKLHHITGPLARPDRGEPVRKSRCRSSAVLLRYRMPAEEPFHALPCQGRQVIRLLTQFHSFTENPLFPKISGGTEISSAASA
jgi:hypothetical protein